MPWFDIKTVRFEFYLDYPNAPGSEPEYVIVREIPSFPGVDTDAEEVTQVIEDARKESGYPPNFMVDTRTQTDWGASGGGQEIVIQFMSDPGVQDIAENLTWKMAQGGALGAGSLMAQKVLGKLGEILRRDRQKARQQADKELERYKALAQESICDEEHTDLDWSVMRAQMSIAGAYRVEWDDLELENADSVVTGAKIVLRHVPSRRRFRVRVDHSGYTISIKSLEPHSDNEPDD